MKYSVINSLTNIVENVVEWDGETLWSPPPGTYITPGYFIVNGLYDPETNTATPPPEEPVVVPVPKSITRRQCAIELRERGQITPREALDMTRNGAPPAMVAGMFTQMPGDAGIIAETDFAAATYMRDNPLLVHLMQANGADEAAIDDFFRAAAAR